MVKISKELWSKVSDEEKQKIIDGLRKMNSIDANESIEGEDNYTTPSHDLDNPIKAICKAACDTTAAAAAAWCTANTSGLGLTACLAAAEVARKACRDRC
ncbi:hypothetical protein LNK20_11235 [Bacillus safensis]|uniref:hypothetical protein n=1 Tax=Bacillus safensis TaxID=561879 RepID=UPI001FF9F6C4|nr:hypothetical protein [Bacillus safensis]MCK1973267.1 hypothetical protein [Bacillus safensis]